MAIDCIEIFSELFWLYYGRQQRHLASRSRLLRSLRSNRRRKRSLSRRKVKPGETRRRNRRRKNPSRKRCTPKKICPECAETACPLWGMKSLPAQERKGRMERQSRTPWRCPGRMKNIGAEKLARYSMRLPRRTRKLQKQRTKSKNTGRTVLMPPAD